MDFKEALYKRASIRKFKNQEVSDELLEELVHYGLRAPSARNFRPWEFYVISNKDVMAKMKEAFPYGNYNCAAMILVCGNTDRFMEGDGKDYWLEDCGAAVENILVGAVSLGLGGIWIGTYPIKSRMDGAKNVLNLPDNIIPYALLEIGYPEEVNPRNINEEDKIHYIK